MTATAAWLTGAPDRFARARVKQRFDIQLGQMLRSTRRSGADREVPYASVSAVQWGRFVPSAIRTMWAAPEEVDRLRIVPGDLLVCEGGEGGRATMYRGSSHSNLITQNHVMRVRPRTGRQVEAEYLRYVLEAMSSLGWLSATLNGATIRSLSKSQLGRLDYAAPAVDEQALAVRYLQHVELRLAAAINAKHELLGLLAARRASVVGTVVLGAGSTTAYTRPTGIRFILNVPDHWDVRRAKWLYREVNERSASGTEELLSVSHLTGVTPRSQKNVTMFKAASYVGHKICRPGDLVVNTMWAWMGALGVTDHTGLISPAYGVYRPLPDSPLTPDFADLILRSRPYIDEYTTRSTGIRSSRLRLYPNQFLSTPIVYPAADEQLHTVARVKAATADLDAAIAATTREIEHLREYRAALVADVITGGKDVRAEAASLPEIDPAELAALNTAGEDAEEETDDD